jgi:hypothetical protein
MNVSVVSRRVTAFVVATAAVFAPEFVMAQDAGKQLQDCRVIANMASRLFCYDRIVDQLTAGAAIVAPQPPTPPPATVPRSAPPAPAQQAVPQAVPQMSPPVARSVPAPGAPAPVPPRAAAPTPTPAAVATPAPAPRQFGDDSLPLDKRAPSPKSSPDELPAKVASIRKDRFGDAIITLDNGQTWRQTEGNSFSAASGTDVILKKGVLGAYFMALADGNRSIKVKRVE